MAKRVVKRVLVEEESSDIVKVYKRIWEEVPDKTKPSKKAAPKPKSTKKVKT